MCIYIYIYIYTHTWRERKREREIDRCASPVELEEHAEQVVVLQITSMEISGNQWTPNKQIRT